MLTLTEHIEINEEVQRIVESEQTSFTDEQIDKAEYFDLKWNPVSFKTALHIYDAAGLSLASVEFDDADVAIEYAMDVFEFDEEDLRDIDSYAWANDGNTELREYDALADDGTSE
jgi:hypothetical protein